MIKRSLATIVVALLTGCALPDYYRQYDVPNNHSPIIKIKSGMVGETGQYISTERQNGIHVVYLDADGDKKLDAVAVGMGNQFSTYYHDCIGDEAILAESQSIFNRYLKEQEKK